MNYVYWRLLEGRDEEGREELAAMLHGPAPKVTDLSARIERRRALALLHGGEVG